MITYETALCCDDTGDDCRSWASACCANAVRSASCCSGREARDLEQIKVHGTDLEGNLEGNAFDRDVLVFLQPSYAKRGSPARRSL